MVDYIDVNNRHEMYTVIKELIKLGYTDWNYYKFIKGRVQSICIFDDGTFQLLLFRVQATQKNMDIGNFKSVKYFLEHKHV